MSIAAAVIRRAREAGVRLSVSDGMLEYSGPTAAVTAELLDLLRRHKAELLELLTRPRSRAVTWEQADELVRSIGRGRPAPPATLPVQAELARIEPEALALGWRPDELRGGGPWRIGADSCNRPSLEAVLVQVPRPEWRIARVTADSAIIDTGGGRTLTFRRTP